MIEQLFGSKTRVKLLQLFYKNPNRSFYVREITRKIDEQINSVRRELANLLSIGIITSDNSDNKLYYEVNQKFEHYDALSSMFGGKKTKPKKAKAKPTADESKTTEESSVDTISSEPEVDKENNIAVDSPVLESLKKVGNLRLAVMTGQFTLDNHTGVDLLLVGDINESTLSHAIEQLEKTEKKSINYVALSSNDFIYRRQVNDRFVANLAIAKKIILLDKDNLLK
ncbi:transcriptional regulator [Candidatus Saccharibacteria bacterium]|jgi:hypothetical protein|nr:transcriptional regulator [Candidatus Saccharibacteria bacterium]